MKLLTPELIKRFKEVGGQSESKNPLVIAKFFDPVGSATWYATENNPKTNICYGYVTGLFVDEWGAFSIDELESIKRPFGLGIERDIHFKETLFKDLLSKQRLLEIEKDAPRSNTSQKLKTQNKLTEQEIEIDRE